MICELCHKDMPCNVYKSNERPSVVTIACNPCHTQQRTVRQSAHDAAHPECVAEREAQRELQRAMAREYMQKLRNEHNPEAHLDVINAERMVRMTSDACAAAAQKSNGERIT